MLFRSKKIHWPIKYRLEQSGFGYDFAKMSLAGFGLANLQDRQFLHKEMLQNLQPQLYKAPAAINSVLRRWPLARQRGRMFSEEVHSSLFRGKDLQAFQTILASDFSLIPKKFTSDHLDSIRYTVLTFKIVQCCTFMAIRITLF